MMTESVRKSAKRHEATKKDRTSQTQTSDHSLSASFSVNRLLFLQRTIGNQAFGRLIKFGALQAKLKIGQPGDKYEREADRVADAVMRMRVPHLEEELRRQPIEEDEEELQTKTASGSIPEVQSDIESHIQSLKGGGRPLSENDRAFFEPRFGHDFTQVRIYTNNNAAKIAHSIQAKAFTFGNDVVFGHGQYTPGTVSGRRLFAHELVHVVQQNSSKLSSTTKHKPNSGVYRCAYIKSNTVSTKTHLCQPFFHPGSCVEPDMPSIMLHEAGRAAGLCGTCTPEGSGGYHPSPFLNSVTNICAYAAFARDSRI